MKSIHGPKQWTGAALLELGRSYQAAAVLAAAAELNLFQALARGPIAAAEVARQRRCKLRGIIVLLDALTALQLLTKRGHCYRLAAGVAPLLTPDGPHSILAMAQHQAHCLRNWSQLAKVVKTGRPAEPWTSVGGEPGRAAAFIGAMHNVSAPVADQVIRALRPLRFTHVLDVGGASGTWTIAFLRACPRARATLFDLPHVIPMAQRRLAAAGLGRRVTLAPGDFMVDPLPPGADVAWVSAIVHQNSRAQNRQLFAKIFSVLVPGGRLVIRDFLMEESRIRPVAGALFAVNMLVATEGGGTFTFPELREDLETCGFAHARVLAQGPTMHSIIVADKPAGTGLG
jgi:precorrin-6B methylase 2